MSNFELKLPKMGESVAEATVTNWLKEIGDTIELDEAIVEIATDKVDSEIPSEVEGVLKQKFFEVDEVVQVGQTIAIIETLENTKKPIKDTPIEEISTNEATKTIENTIQELVKDSNSLSSIEYKNSERFYSPLVKNIAKKEGLSLEELESIRGTGKNDRVTKNDIKNYIATRKTESKILPSHISQKADTSTMVRNEAGDEIIEMTRMGKLIAHHMVESVRVSAHVQSFIEVDVTNIVNWRSKIKDIFQQKTGEKLTFTPIFMEAIAKILGDYPMMNISLDGDTIIKKKAINLGMATALADGNLIVPVIKNADQQNLIGMAKSVNDLANRARNNALKPEEIQGGTYTVTNVGSFGSIFGTPIINQPQVGILALGAIRKVPAVVETSQGDFIGIRQKMFLSHSYDHRVVNGALGGSFIKAIKEHLENWDIHKTF